MSKAESLHVMKSLGLNVPNFVVIDEPIDVMDYLNNIKYVFSDIVSIRSSGSVSTPGRMKTVLNVPFEFEKVKTAVNEVFKSAKEKRVTDYLKSINYDVNDFKVQCIIQDQIPVDTSTSDFSAIIHAKFGSDGFQMEWARCQGDKLMSGEVTPQSYTFTFGHDVFHKIKLLSLHYQTDIEVEVTYHLGNYYFLQCRPTDLQQETTVETSPAEIYARYLINVSDTITGHVTTNLNHPNPEECFYLTQDTVFEDLPKLLRFKALLTTRGGKMCHAGAICRIHNKPAALTVVGYEHLKVNTLYSLDAEGTFSEINS